MERRLVPLKGCFAVATLVITRDGPVPIRDLVAIEAKFLSTSGDPAEGDAERKWARTQVTGDQPGLSPRRPMPRISGTWWVVRRERTGHSPGTPAAPSTPGRRPGRGSEGPVLILILRRPSPAAWAQ